MDQRVVAGGFGAQVVLVELRGEVGDPFDDGSLVVPELVARAEQCVVGRRVLDELFRAADVPVAAPERGIHGQPAAREQVQQEVAHLVADRRPSGGGREGHHLASHPLPVHGMEEREILRRAGLEALGGNRVVVEVDGLAERDPFGKPVERARQRLGQGILVELRPDPGELVAAEQESRTRKGDALGLPSGGSRPRRERGSHHRD